MRGWRIVVLGEMQGSLIFSLVKVKDAIVDLKIKIKISYLYK